MFLLDRPNSGPRVLMVRVTSVLRLAFPTNLQLSLVAYTLSRPHQHHQSSFRLSTTSHSLSGRHQSSSPRASTIADVSTSLRSHPLSSLESPCRVLPRIHLHLPREASTNIAQTLSALYHLLRINRHTAMHSCNDFS